ncbi:MAG TPA: Calx-beta domain-containing protein [Verrucomicrobiae bacterium]|nr:Calx-beta domain-containing protein [Verrucomicrobiae bacterium]
MSFTNSWARPMGFNNARDILAVEKSSIPLGGKERYSLLRDGNQIKLWPVSDPLVVHANAVSMSERSADGHVFVAGKAVCVDGYDRACVWDIALDKTFKFTLAQVVTNGSGQKLNSGAVAVNSAGVMVGNVSYAIFDPLRWAPPYEAAQRIVVSSANSAGLVNIDESGDMLVTGAEFGKGTPQHHLAAAVVSANGTVTEIPRVDPTGPWYGDPPIFLPGGISNYLNTPIMKRGDWVAGMSPVGSSTAAFAWRVGMTNAIKLPGSTLRGAHAVNASGQALGNDSFWFMPILWQIENGAYVAYDLFRLIPADSFYPNRVDFSFINDAGEALVEYVDSAKFPTETVMRIYSMATDGVVNFFDPWLRGYESKPIGATGTNWTTGGVDFRVNLTRGSYSGVVTVNYRTVEGTAKPGVNYIPAEGSISWGPRESGRKTVRVPLIDNVEFDAEKTLTLELTSATGAQLPEQRTFTALISEWDPGVIAANSIYSSNTGWTVPVAQGASQAFVRLQRVSSNDGKLIITNFVGLDDVARKGVDYQIPEGLSASWEAGEMGLKTISISLLPITDVTTNRIFAVSANLLIEGTTYYTTAFFAVLIVPRDAGAFAVFYQAGGPFIADGKIHMPVLARQGATIELLKGPTVNGPWAVESEATSLDGALMLEAPIKLSGAEFFRLRDK